MKPSLIQSFLIIFIYIALSPVSYSQEPLQEQQPLDDTVKKKGADSQYSDSLLNDDSLSTLKVGELNSRLEEIESLRVRDSLKKAELQEQINSLKTTENLKKEELLKQLEEIERDKQIRLEQRRSKIDSLRKFVKGYPVTGVLKDTLFFIYARLGASTPFDRSVSITQKVYDLYDDDFLKPDSIMLIPSEYMTDIAYGESIIMSVSDQDAIWNNTSVEQLSADYLSRIKSSILKAREERSIPKLLTRIGLALLVILITWIVIRMIGKGMTYLYSVIVARKAKWFNGIRYKDYTILSIEQELTILKNTLRVVKWILYLLLLYLAFPIIFSIFPFTRNWADNLFTLLWRPFAGIANSVWDYMPNLFSIFVILLIMIYLKRLVKYIFSEIEAGRLKFHGFHSDWAMPTYSIVRFLLFAFTFVLIFPYLPGSDSEIFKGVSVFIGVLFSLGSTSAIANMVAGLVITYMRPFQLGDFIKMGEVTGRVIEKNLLVTRVMTVKNETITIPNATILTGNTMNYSSAAQGTGLILHTSVTIGYGAPWKDVHSALIEAANRTEHLMKEPKPFVFQTSLDDFYVSYQLNAYTKSVLIQSAIYSSLHQNIQDVFNERGIEIMSPHYRSERDGNTTTIPSSYLPPDYKAPGFRIDLRKSGGNEDKNEG